MFQLWDPVNEASPFHGTMTRFASILRGGIRRVAMAPMQLVGGRIRSEAVELLASGMIVETPVPSGVLRFFAPTPLLQDRAAAVMTKEPDMIGWIDRMEADAVLWDIGSNVGVFSLYAAVKTRRTVLAFEPSASNFFVLVRNIQLNALDARVTAYCVALSGATGLGVLNLASTAMGASLTQFGKRGDVSRFWDDEIKSTAHGMVGFTIDEFASRFEPPFPTHIKMDVDGLEWPILQGAVKTLRDPRLRSAMVELSLTNLQEREDAIALMESSGLRFVSRGEPQALAGQAAANHLFERATA